MACALIQGHENLCRESVGGIDTVYITELSNKSAITETSGTITAFTLKSGKKFWTYEVQKENASAKSAITVSVENATTFYQHEVSFMLPKLRSYLRNEIQSLAETPVMIIVKDMNGTYWLYGKNKGMDLTSGDSNTGKAMGDMSGYNLTFTGKEADLEVEVTASLITALTTAAA